MNLKFVFYIYIFYISLSLALRSWLICVHFIIVKNNEPALYKQTFKYVNTTLLYITKKKLFTNMCCHL